MRGINFAIGMGVAILLPMLITYGVNLLHPPPQFDEYHTLGPPGPGPVSQAEFERRDKISREEREQYSAANLEYSKTFFYVALPIGLLLVIGGAIVKVAAVGNGLVFGGVFTLITGYYSHWYHLSDLTKFGSLLVALVLLIATAYRVYGKQQ